MTFLTDNWYQLKRHLRTQIRMPVWIFVNLFQPVLWLLLFTQVFKSLANLPGLGGFSYLQFFSPGVIVMTVMFGSAWAGMGMLEDIDMGILAKMLATPVSRLSILVSRVLASMIMLIIQALIIFILAIILGVHLETGLPGVLLTIILISLLGLGFAAFSNGLALLLRRAEPLIGLINLATLPMMFLSSTMMATSLLPHWLNVVRRFNPVDYAVVGVRDLILHGYIWSDLWRSLAVLSAWALAGITFGILMFRIRADQ